MIFKLTGLKNMDFSDFKGRPQGMVNLGAPIWDPKSKKFSRIAMALILFPSESCQSEFYKYVKFGAQNAALKQQFYID